MKHEVEKLQVLLETNRLQTEKLMDEQVRMEGIVKQHEEEKGLLLQDIMKLLTEREETFNNFEEICNKIGELSTDDAETMQILGKMLQMSEEETGLAMDLVVHNELYNSTSKNPETLFSVTLNKLQARTDERPPLKEVNL